MLCGKTRCPVMVRANCLVRAAPFIDSLEIDGASPPGIFIGRIGYPYVYAGPMVPPIHEDTAVYDLPELWFGKAIDEIVSFRSMLIRGKHRVHVSRLSESNKIIDMTRELALSSTATDVELALKKKPQGSLHGLHAFTSSGWPQGTTTGKEGATSPLNPKLLPARARARGRR